MFSEVRVQLKKVRAWCIAAEDLPLGERAKPARSRKCSQSRYLVTIQIYMARIPCYCRELSV